ncbi:MAG: hypothetical protein ACOYB3_09685 [Azonexus sp.]
MPKPKPAPSLGFDLAELATQVEHYQGPPQAPEEPQEVAAPVGRPRTLPDDAQPFSARLSAAQREWLLREAARRTLASGERHDASRIVRELIDRARGVA